MGSTICGFILLGDALVLLYIIYLNIMNWLKNDKETNVGSIRPDQCVL